MFLSIREKVHLILKDNKRRSQFECIKICVIYLGISSIWVYFSNKIADKFVDNKYMLLMVNTCKGWLYVIIVTAILYLLIMSLLKKVNLTENKLNESYEELSAVNKELEAYVQQLTASKEELRAQYEQITENEKQLSIIEEKNKAIVEAIPDLLFVINKEGFFIDCITSDESSLLMPKKDFIRKNIRQIMPKEITNIWEKKIDALFNGGGLQTFEYELKIGDIDHYYELRMVKSSLDEVLAISRDITVQRQNELELKASEYTFRKLFESSSDAILIFEDYLISDCNKAMIELLGFDSKLTILGKTAWAFSPAKQPDGISSKEKIREILKTIMKNGKHRFEWWHEKNDGTLFPVEVVMTTIVLHGKTVIHCLIRDISHRKNMEHELQYLSYNDQLTGLHNRRFFEEELKRVDLKGNYPLSIIMADVNGLKLVNDSFGHNIGDELLKKVSEILKKGCRADDVIARLGGDEFVIILLKTDNYETEQIIKRIEALALKEKVSSVGISVSFGYGIKNNENEGIQEIFKKAEDYMYKKKLFESPSMRGKTIRAIINTLHEKNKREEEHSNRVSRLCKSMGIALGLPEGEIEEIKTIGLLHDIGKIAIDENILNKSGKLTDEEWKEIKRHPEIGYRILSTVNDMSEMADYVLAHHERWDGNGYPKGLKGEEIPFLSRIIAIADSYDAIISERSYRSALPEEVAIKELITNSGTQFDPKLVPVFIEKVLMK